MIAVFSQPDAYVLAAIVALIGLVYRVRREFRPNHGGSMRDAIDRMEANQAEFKTDLREMKDDVRLIRDDQRSDHTRITRLEEDK